MFTFFDKFLAIFNFIIILLSIVFGMPWLNKNIVVLYTNDVHCAVDDNIGYAGLAAYKKEEEEQTPNVTLVDCGDAVQGGLIGTVSTGGYIVDIMNKVGYDIAVPGNHEFDYGMDRLGQLIGSSDADYLCANVAYTGSGTSALADTKPYEIVDYDGTQVAYIGVVTPECITSSTPSYFMENGSYVYDFSSGNDGEELYDCVQADVDERRADGADYVIVCAHLGDTEEYSPYSSVDLAENTTGIDVVLDGHAHDVVPSLVEQNEKGQDVIISSTGTKLTNIGKLTITPDGDITTELVSSYDKKDADTKSYIDGIKSSFAADMNKVVATSDTALSCSDTAGVRIVRTRETAIGDFCADAYRDTAKSDIAFVNGGGIRADLPAGNITYSQMIAVHPFGNYICCVKATGQQVLDALEVASSSVKSVYAAGGKAVGENGGFLQVSGLSYTVDTSVPSSVVTDASGMFAGVSGARRVKDVMVLTSGGSYKAIDPAGVYTVASNNYIIKSGGNGMNMFMGDQLLMDEGMVDCEALINYIKDTLHGSLGAKYSAPDGRITIE